jgi:predicted phage terminase large subunit-like protein
MNRDVQRIIDDPRYRELFPGTTLSSSNVRAVSGNYLRNSDIFEVVGRSGTYLSAGVGGGITGRGFDVGIIDDPVKNRAEANSPTFRERLWDWYRSTFYTRREKDAKIIVIMTRWHEDDLVGRLLELQDSDPWRVVSFPAVFEGVDGTTYPGDKRSPGEALWPGKFPPFDLERIKINLGSYEWAGLYQQAPAPSGGGIFMASWWMSYDYPPTQFDEVIQSWDCAFKSADTSDFVVGQVWGRVKERYYLLDQARDRLDFPQTIRAVRNLSVKWPRAVLKLVEDKANGPAVLSMLKRELPGLTPVEPQGGKEARAYAVSALVEAGNVFIPARAPWRDDFIAEVSAFPNGRNDDQVDAMTQALSRLSRKKGGWSFIGGKP